MLLGGVFPWFDLVIGLFTARIRFRCATCFGGWWFGLVACVDFGYCCIVLIVLFYLN